MRAVLLAAATALGGCSTVDALPPGRGAAARATGTSDCGLGDPTLPAFELVDENPASPTEGVAYASSDFLGRVLVMYWAVAT